MLEKTVILPAIHQMGKNRRSTVSEQTHTGHVTPKIKSCSWEGDSTKTLHRGHVLVFEKGATPDLCVCVSTRVSASIFFYFFFVSFWLTLVAVWNMDVHFFYLKTDKDHESEKEGNKKNMHSWWYAHTFSTHADTRTHTYLVQSSTKAGDVGATTRGCYNAVARPTRNVVINLCSYNEIITWHYITLHLDR